jgi:ribonucleoside-triphosphate reductase
LSQELPTNFQEYIHKSRYARWNYALGRRETWAETVDRYINYFSHKFPQVPGEQWSKARDFIFDLKVMPSMRCLMTAGEALDRDNVAGFNCSYVAVDTPRVFDEIMYVLMCGTGVGFSVERQYINQLPVIADEFFSTDSVIKVADSKIGWASSFRELVSLLYAGKIPKWDLSKIRPAGAVLKTFGGRASGPRPLDDLFKFTVEIFKNAAGRKLNSIECHDLVCKIAEIVVVGGVVKH